MTPEQAAILSEVFSQGVRPNDVMEAFRAWEVRDCPFQAGQELTFTCRVDSLYSGNDDFYVLLQFGDEREPREFSSRVLLGVLATTNSDDQINALIARYIEEADYAGMKTIQETLCRVVEDLKAIIGRGA